MIIQAQLQAMGDLFYQCWVTVKQRERKGLALLQAGSDCGVSPFRARTHCFGKNWKNNSPYTAGYTSFGPLTQCVVHALKGLGCRAPVLLAHAEVALQAVLNAHVAFAPRAQLRQALSRTRRSQQLN